MGRGFNAIQNKPNFYNSPFKRGVYKGNNNNSKEAELCASKDCPCTPLHKRYGSVSLHPRRTAQKLQNTQWLYYAVDVEGLGGVRYHIVRVTIDATGVDKRRQGRSLTEQSDQKQELLLKK